MRLDLSANSVYYEARDEYLELRQELSIRGAMEEFKRVMADELSEETDRCFCIAALAKAQIRRKELVPEVASELKEALTEIERQYAESGASLSPKDIDYFEKRVHDPDFFAKEEQMDVSPRRVRPREFRCRWEIGDTFAFTLKLLR